MMVNALPEDHPLKRGGAVLGPCSINEAIVIACAHWGIVTTATTVEQQREEARGGNRTARVREGEGEDGVRWRRGLQQAKRSAFLPRQRSARGWRPDDDDDDDSALSYCRVAERRLFFGTKGSTGPRGRRRWWTMNVTTTMAAASSCLPTLAAE